MRNPSSTKRDVPEESIVNRLFRKQNFRVSPGRQRNHELHTRLLDSLNNWIAFGNSNCECFLCKDMFPGFSGSDHYARMVGRDCINGDCVYIVAAENFIEIGVEWNVVLFSGISSTVFLFVPDGNEFGFRVFVNFSCITTSVDMRHTNLCDSNHF